MEPEQLILPLDPKPHDALNAAYRTGVQQCINILEMNKAKNGAITPIIDSLLVPMKELLKKLYA